MTICEEKKILRSKIKEILKTEYSDKTLRQAFSKIAVEKLASQKYFKEADFVFLYVPYGNEIDDFALKEIAWNEGKEVFVPKIYEGTSEMDFYLLVKSKPILTQLSKGSFGILEPNESLKKIEISSEVLRDKKILIVVPGLAFTENGARLGKGKGFYDIYISRLKVAGLKVFTVGFCYPLQIVKNIPMEKTDVFLDAVIKA
ncbi:5-formyltetrahydrofolate cyclo-ligase [Treponema pectinovorum]|uniref:5-formyltetrahydrofolate cyclo-ligase n=1 Tax=Treponema pectinovorum TaxID=164 RepID=UPI003D92E2E9